MSINPATPRYAQEELKMTNKKEKVLVALSGGVDSSTAAAILLEKGFDCAGVFMLTCDHSHIAQADAQRTADKLGMKLYILDLRRDFEQILDYFCNEYSRGRTPNPCIVCNRKIKFGILLNFARDNGAELFATGHYARIIKASNNIGLYEAPDSSKDQSYALAMIDNSVLGHIILPMGNYSKTQTRELAAKFGLEPEEKQESQEICFIPNNHYTVVLEERNPQLVRKGNIVDSDGRILGEHHGVHHFTIGQRRGLRIAMGKPYYVVKIEASSNTVTLGPQEELMHRKLLATDLNWLIPEPESPFRAKVKIRYNSKGTWATVSPKKPHNGEFFTTVEFDEPESAVTPGQAAVFYVQQGLYNRVVGAGWIDTASN